MQIIFILGQMKMKIIRIKFYEDTLYARQSKSHTESNAAYLFVYLCVYWIICTDPKRVLTNLTDLILTFSKRHPFRLMAAYIRTEN